MGVRFVIGRAGTGKTARMLEAVRAELGRSPWGPRLLLLVPEQATFQVERALLEASGFAGFLRAEVLSFRRLARRVLAESGGPLLADLSARGRAMILRRLLAGAADFPTFGRLADRPGVVARLGRTIGELEREAVTPSQLRALLEGRIDPATLLGRKIADLATLYERYQAALEGEHLDPDALLGRLGRAIARCPWLRGARIWVDGFAGFTRAERGVLVDLARLAASVDVTLLADPASPVFARPRPETDAVGLFRRTERTYRQLSGDLAAAGIHHDGIVRLRPPSPPRFRGDPDLVRLERYAFATRPERADGPPRSIEVGAFPDRRGEVDAAAREILRLVRDEGYRFRDIAVVARDLEPYHDLATASLAEHGIPFFLDRRRPTAHHPLVEFVRGLVEIARDDAPLEAWRRFLKTGLLDADGEDLDRLENHAIARGIRGEGWWREEPWSRPAASERRGSDDRDLQEASQAEDPDLEAVLRTRRAIVEPLRAWKASAAGERPVRAWARDLFLCLEACGVPVRIETRAAEAEAGGDPGAAEEDRQVLSDFAALLDEMVAALGGEAMGPEAFARILEAGLEGFDIGLAPPAVDQVLVGSIERSRHPEIRALLVLGFAQDLFPLVHPEDVVLDDADREALEGAGLELASRASDQLLDERLLAYIVLTRASERLWVSYPQADDEGRALDPSPYLRELEAIFPDLEVRRPRPSPADPLDSATTPLRAAALLAGKIRAEGRNLQPPLRGAYEIARRDLRDGLRPVFRSLAYRNVAKLAKELRGGKEVVEASVSEMETFAECPFRHFGLYTLALRERQVHGLQAIDLGIFEHEVLEILFRELGREGEKLEELDRAAIRERLGRIIAERAGDLGDPEAPRIQYLQRRTRRRLERVLGMQALLYARGRIIPRAAELAFGGRRGPGALEIPTPEGRTLALRGRIDRVDVDPKSGLAFVFDYKLGSERRIDMREIHAGLSLALPAYLLALAESDLLPGRAKPRPAGAFYQSLTRKLESVGDAKKLARIRERDEGLGDLWKLKPRGIFSSDAIDALDAALEAGWSPVVAAYRKRDGELGDPEKSDWLAPEDLARLLALARRKLGEFADRIHRGEIRVRPYLLRGRTPCTRCELRALCRFEKAYQREKYRRIDVATRAAALARIREAATEGVAS